MVNFETTPESADNSAARKEWTFLIYMAGDNNLNDDMIRGVIEMRTSIGSVGDELMTAGTLSEKSKIGVVVGFDGEHPLRNLVRCDLSYTNAESYESDAKPQPIKVPDQSDGTPTGEAAGRKNDEPPIKSSISAFLAEAIKLQPADNYCLIFSGHSDAFQGRTLLADENPPGTMTLSEIKEVLNNYFGNTTGNNLEILAFDGCVMNTIEVMYEFKDTAEVWIGSQGSIPNYTWDYAKIMRRLINTPAGKLDSEKISDVIFDAVAEFNKKYSFGGRSVDISSCRLKADEFERLVRLINFGGLILLIILLNPNSAVVNLLLKILLQAHWNCQTYMRNQSVDLIDFFGRVREECTGLFRTSYLLANDVELSEDELAVLFEKQLSEVNLSKNIESLSAAMNILTPGILLTIIRLFCDEVVGLSKKVFRGRYTGADYRFSNGCSIFLPWSFLGFEMSKKEYKKLEFSKKIGWIYFLDYYVRITARPKPSVINLNPEIEKLIAIVISNLPILLTTKNFSDFVPDIDINRIEMLLEGLGEGTKDNPNRTKGLENYLYYFEKTTNFYPDLSENLEGRFPS